jgi:hypothetical protein
MDKIMEIIYWIQIFISPLLVSVIIAAIAYFNIPNNYWLPSGILIIGAIVGIIFAERIRRKYGTTTFMGRLRGNSDSMEDNLNKKSK